MGTSDRLASPDLDVPISFFYGDNDWVIGIEEEAAQNVIEQNKYFQRSTTAYEKMYGIEYSNVFYVPTSDHNMHMDNPEALANLILNDCFDLGLEIRENEKNILKEDYTSK